MCHSVAAFSNTCLCHFYAIPTSLLFLQKILLQKTFISYVTVNQLSANDHSTLHSSKVCLLHFIVRCEQVQEIVT